MRRLWIRWVATLARGDRYTLGHGSADQSVKHTLRSAGFKSFVKASRPFGSLAPPLWVPPHHSTTPPLHHSTTPPLHHSTTPPLHHSPTPPLHHSTPPPPHHPSTPLLPPPPT